MKHIIGFPGLFKSEYVIDRVAFDLGKLFGMDKSIPIYWYGLIIVAAMIVAYFYFSIRAKRTEGIETETSMDLILFAIPIGLVGARAFYVLTNLDRFHSLKGAVLGVRDGGLAIYGGLVFGLITILVFCRIKKINFLKVLDAIVPAVMIAQAIGRWGNFVNAEAYGMSKGVENFFLRMTIADYNTPNIITTVHPTFLYESLWNVLGFIVANLLYRKKKFDGQILCLYLFWYGVGRGFIELLRTDSCMILEKFIKKDPLDVFGTSSGDGLKAFVYLSMALVIASVVLYFFLKKKCDKENEDISALKELLAEGEDSAETTENSESSETVETAEATESTETTEGSEKSESAEGTEGSEKSENTEGTDEPSDGDGEYEDGEEGDDSYDE